MYIIYYIEVYVYMYLFNMYAFKSNRLYMRIIRPAYCNIYIYLYFGITKYILKCISKRLNAKKSIYYIMLLKTVGIAWLSSARTLKCRVYSL